MPPLDDDEPLPDEDPPPDEPPEDDAPPEEPEDDDEPPPEDEPPPDPPPPPDPQLQQTNSPRTEYARRGRIVPWWPIVPPSAPDLATCAASNCDNAAPDQLVCDP